MAIRAIQGKTYLSFLEGVDDTSATDSTMVENTLSRAWNLDLIDDTLAVKRKGYTPINQWGTRIIRQGLEYSLPTGNRETVVFGTDTSGGTFGRMVTSGTPTPIASSLINNVKPTILQFRDRVLVFLGSGNFLYNGSTTRQIGITSADAKPTFITNIAGSLNTNGTYIYAYTYYNSTTGAESSPSLPSNLMASGASGTTSGIRISVTAGDATTADKIRIYRSVSGGSIFFLEAAIDISATTYDSVVSDAGLGSELELDNSRLDETAKFAVIGDNRIFAGGFDTNPNRLQYSKIGLSGPMPESFQADDLVDCNITDGDKILGLGWTNNTVIVIKEHSVGRLIRIDTTLGGLERQGSGKYLYEEISNKVTGISQGPIVTMDNMVIWMGRDDIYGTDGVQIVRFGQRIQKTLRSLNYAQAWKFSGINKTNTKQIIFSVCSAGKTEPDLQIVGHYRYFPKIAWSFYTPGTNTTTHPGIPAASFFEVTSNNEKVYYFGSSDSSGYIHQMDFGTNDNTKGIAFDMRVPWLSMKSAAMRKMFHSYYTFAVGEGAAAYSLTHTFERDNSEIVVKTATSSLSPATNPHWATTNWAAFNWASVGYVPLRFYPRVRAYFGRYGVQNYNADQPVAISGITAVVQTDPIHR